MAELTRRISQAIRYFLRQVRRVVEWLPVIWRNHDYDFGCNLDIFWYSLERTSRHIREHSFAKDADEVAGQIEDVVMMIRAYQNDDWFEDVCRSHKEKWGDSRWIFFPAIDHPGFHATEVYYDKADTLDKHIQAYDEFFVGADDAVTRQQEIWKKIWRRIAKQMETWWD